MALNRSNKKWIPIHFFLIHLNGSKQLKYRLKWAFDPFKSAPSIHSWLHLFHFSSLSRSLTTLHLQTITEFGVFSHNKQQLLHWWELGHRCLERSVASFLDQTLFFNFPPLWLEAVCWISDAKMSFISQFLTSNLGQSAAITATCLSSTWANSQLSIQIFLASYVAETTVINVFFLSGKRFSQALYEQHLIM